MKRDPAVVRALTVSTEHLDAAGREWINEYADARDSHYEMNWLVGVGPVEADAGPPSVVAAMEAAKARGCEWLIVDADATVLVEGLPLYNEEEEGGE